jgi:hypothetical protein
MEHGRIQRIVGDAYHRDDQPREVAAAAAGRAPVVLVETATDTIHLLGPEDIAACQGSPGQLVDAILAAVARQALSWPVPLSSTVTGSSPPDQRPTTAQQPKAGLPCPNESTRWRTSSPCVVGGPADKP